jgi:2-oxoglutarate dehydrogenase E2 component (dihydrolipoamide succinyltransferase)
MSTKVEIPSLGESVTEAILAKWLKEEGATVKADEPVCELETDKANVEIPAPAAGILKHLVKPGDTVKIGDAIAEIQAGGVGTSAPTAKAALPSKPAATMGSTSATGQGASAAPDAGDTSEENLSPSVRRLVREHHVDVQSLHGTGPRGRIVKEDVLRVVESGAGSVSTSAPTKAGSAPGSSAKTTDFALPSFAPVLGGTANHTVGSPPAGVPKPAITGPGQRRVPMTKIRKRIAERLVAAQHNAAMLTTFNEIDMSQVLELRDKYRESFQAKHGVSLGLMSFFARACALALKEYPTVNAFIEGEDVVYNDAVHLGIAVSTERGLVVPVLRNVGDMSFATVEGEIKRMAVSARDGKLALTELSGGTFTITNGGVFGSLMSTPILNPPQSGILGMHAIQKRPVVVNDQIIIRPMMYVALSYDHRLVDGRESVSFLVKVKQLIEDPHRLMLAV